MGRQDEFSIDLFQIAALILRKWWVVAITSILSAVLVFLYTFFMVTPLYESKAMMYVNNTALSVGNKLSISYQDIYAGQYLVNTYRVILSSRLTLEEVIEEADLDYSYEELKSMITTESIDETEIFSIAVKSPDPKEASKIANTITTILPDRVASILDGSSVRTVDFAVTPSAPCSPSFGKNTAIGFIVGFAIGVVYLLIREFLNDTVTSQEWIISTFGEEIPLLTVVPDVDAKIEGTYSSMDYYGADKTRNKSV